MLYPLIWQLAEFCPFATAFETILSESLTFATRLATLDRWIGYLVIGLLSPMGLTAVDSPGRGRRWLTRIRRPGLFPLIGSMQRQLSATSSLRGFMFGLTSSVSLTNSA